MEVKIIIENVGRDIITLYADGGEVDIVNGNEYHVDFKYKVNGRIFETNVTFNFGTEPTFEELKEAIASTLGYELIE